MTDTNLIERLEKATEGSAVVWCPKCLRIVLCLPSYGSGSKGAPLPQILNDVTPCDNTMTSISPADCIAALRARQSETSDLQENE